MSKGTPLRTIRINDDLWNAVKTKAETEGRSVSDIIRELIKRWVEEDEPV